MQRAAVLLAASLLTLPLFASAASSDIRITPDGVVTMKNLTVMQKSGMNLFMRATWGTVFIRLVVLAQASTTVEKNHGEGAVVADISQGDILDVEGTLATGADSMIVNATRIRDLALEKEGKVFSGTIASLDAQSHTFLLQNRAFGTTTVSVPASLPVKKGVRTIPFSELRMGDRVLSVKGTYDYPTNTLTATELEIFQDTGLFKPRNFQGTLKSISPAGANAAPATLVVTVDGKDYTVYLAGKAAVLRNNRSPASLARFVAGDTVRFWGSIRQTDFSQIDSDLVRDLNF